MEQIELAGVVCARVCHDLAGTLGALAGMLEMAGEDADALAVARACAAELSARLQLLRAAWGHDSEVGDLASLAAGLPGAERLRVEVGDLGEAPGLRRLAACALLVAAAGLPRGGDIRITAQDGGLRVCIGGARAAWPEWLGAAAAPEPRSVAGAMMAVQARAAGLRLEVVSSVELRLV
jgi:histidine phosphotransferase ChpT